MEKTIRDNEKAQITKRLYEMGIHYVMVDGEVLYISEEYKKYIELRKMEMEA